jgi:hypothetical protein
MKRCTKAAAPYGRSLRGDLSHRGAIDLRHFKDEQIGSMLEALLA